MPKTTPNVENVSRFAIYGGSYASTWNLKGLNKLIGESTTDLNNFMYANYKAGSYRDFGTIDVYGGNMYAAFSLNKNIKLTLNLHGNITNYDDMFHYAAETQNSEVIINYTSNVDIDTIMSAFVDNPRIKKGSLLDS